MKVHKLTPYTNGKGEERVLLTAVQEVSMLNGLASAKTYGKLTFPVGTKIADVEASFPVGAELPGVKFGDKFVDSETGEISNFHRIIPE